MSITERIKNYLGNGGLINPELMEHEKVRDLIMDCRDEIQSLKEEIDRNATVWDSTCLGWYFKIEELEKQNNSMKEALEFYANVDSWFHTDSYNVTGTIIDESDEESLDIKYKSISGGKRARQALEKIK